MTEITPSYFYIGGKIIKTITVTEDGVKKDQDIEYGDYVGLVATLGEYIELKLTRKFYDIFGKPLWSQSYYILPANAMGSDSPFELRNILKSYPKNKITEGQFNHLFYQWEKFMSKLIKENK